ncbi:purine-nucleoside phosphorylase [Clostridium thermosuccinogenes]|uniref:Purine nucleoside phosphorylase n=1 Tax=Clostridium thermosuccinogenes TaxID=84032 RepID=A0A2K2FM63_9CLOT|nr:purine-nucleoside phosphorylase [Pseudoclostridium thermosuccinogenes]AUS98677.1 purine-nucleoside phosphorylase [Pseudoclostridium thermosuccinogenes]PNT99866.1 purine-nucleoside phosphorylase [Pseudoclostridium thermosuccinogenes]PNU01425.1 purine-nucleoside phosphorylase [Pseudoclostridium thermosuccinogenes]
MDDLYRKAAESAEYIQKRLTTKPQIGIVLGSGLGPLVNEVKEQIEIDYGDIPNFPIPTVEGHAGKLIAGEIGGKPVLVMKGRFHFYEGYDISQVVFHIRVFKLLGISHILVTNAAGGVNRDFSPGDLMLITDHISFFAPSPLRGKNVDEFGVRFPDMSEAYNKELIAMAEKTAGELGIKLQKGVYAFTQGPMYETPAEIRALRILGADAVGMSTVPEVIAARHAGMKVLGISCITNMAAGILEQPLSHEEVMETAKKVEARFVSLVNKLISNWNV